MNLLRTLAFSIFFYGLSVPMVLLVPLVALLGGDSLRSYAMGWVALMRWSARWILGIRVKIEGEIPKGPVLFAGKHESLFEALELSRLLGSPATVMKRELARIPLWGWAARRYGVIIVNRTANASALRAMMKDAQAALKQGRSVMIFPEGTRVKPGEKPELRSGFAGLYRMLDLPVVPIAVKSGHVWPKHGIKKPGVVTFRFEPMIPPGLPRAEAEARVHAGINALNG
ncbi:MAG: 1-acyl-sn-glycerol-3-phosphate acyltransferase [Sphingomonas sp.]|uniref:lysophospholipid acyltransferase family protein n=1 Tax=unclassified Sphingomonas TaxID=196159 RepID=UPI0024540AB1|nr:MULTISPECIES: lysophospholipid acyltransferase family protein [unclassified Sphingomonas]MBQ1497789.1 1-acyl-sn-glycerol-3-phosphate acyltransferase [Sphingomonas sp.]MDH4746337.1 1-acyl-sn-glycerol-3-phosphate acyltransferase [Sphingomonas sp. CBMAI 2297]